MMILEYAEFPSFQGLYRIGNKEMQNYFREILDFHGPRGVLSSARGHLDQIGGPSHADFNRRLNVWVA